MSQERAYDKLSWQTKQFGNPQLGDSVLDALANPSETAVAAEDWERDRGTTTLEERPPGATLLTEAEGGLGGFETVYVPANDQPVKFDSVLELKIATSKHRDVMKNKADAVHVPPPPVEEEEIPAPDPEADTEAAAEEKAAPKKAPAKKAAPKDAPPKEDASE